MSRVWVTRAQPRAEATAARLRELGHLPLVVPVLEVRPLPDAHIDLSGVSALAFTSRNGVEAFARLSAERGLPVFAVGDATAEVAKAAGFGRVQSAVGDVQALADLIASNWRAEEPPPPCGEGAGGGGVNFQGAPLEDDTPIPNPFPARGKGLSILHPGAREPAGDLPGLLAKSGIELRTAPLYETVETPASPPPDIDAVLLHSPKAARAVARLLAGDDISTMTALCISEAAAAPLRPLNFGRIAVARFPNETALLKLLKI